MSMEALTIQQAAAHTGLSVHTLRYYERNGLLAPVTRAANGHRRYLAADLVHIEFLNRLRMTGMPIRQMQQFVTLLREKPEAIADRCAILQAHEQAVIDRIQQLSFNLTVIQQKITTLQAMEAEQRNGLSEVQAS
jgi:DNA-binding transcriptional MerR regulator